MLTVSSGDVDVAKITGDGDWLLVIDETGNSYIFNYNLTSD